MANKKINSARYKPGSVFMLAFLARRLVKLKIVSRLY
jgi:hypothetical protein